MPENLDIWKFLAGLGIFLFGMHFLEIALKNLAGSAFKKFLRKHTTNPLKGVLSGTIVTALLQSSSVVSLMVLAFVGAGIITLRNAIGILFGSNLGTTFTGWVVATLGFEVNIENFSFPFIAIGGISMLFFSKNEKISEIGRFLLGFGFLFLGLEYMKSSIEFVSETFDISLFASWNPYLFFLIGFVLTAIIQSSSAAMVITLSALSTNMIALEAAAAMVIGNDLGTTITVMIGGLNGTPAKKRVALSHFLFNLITDVIALIALYPLLYFITEIIALQNPLFTLVFFHSMFNLLGIFLMLPFLGIFAKFLESRFTNEETSPALYINKVPTEIVDTALEALEKELFHLVENVFLLALGILKINKELFEFPDQYREGTSLYNSGYIERYENIKQLEGEVVAYCLKVQNEKINDEESQHLNQYIHAARNIMIAAKDLKDIGHNIRDFEKSSNDSKLSLHTFLKGQLNEFYLALHHVFHSEKEATYFEALSELAQQNQNVYDKFLQETYQEAQKKHISETELSTLLNVNRQIFNANKGLILGIKDLLLSREQSESFNSIAELNVY